MREDREKALQGLEFVRGQIAGMIKIIEDKRYYTESPNQMVAAQVLLKRTNLFLLKQHLNHCVTQAYLNGGSKEKIDRIITVLEKAAIK
ncbi:MAG: metal-sensing transcriptional repressor [Turicibacter sp.]|nr:metal-sensing transcriptional repressor [Turicibacter sp.]